MVQEQGNVTAPTSLSDGRGCCGNTHPCPSFNLLIEGWRSYPHSYSLVNHYQCGELLNRPGVSLYHRDVSPIRQIGQPERGMFDDGQERRIGSIPSPTRTTKVHAVYRIAYPYDFGPSVTGSPYVFATCERMVLRPDQWYPGTKPLRTVIDQNNITIITPSVWSRNGFVRSGIEMDRIKIVPHGVDPTVFYPVSSDERAAMKDRMGYGGKFVYLHVSALTGNKNPVGILRAFVPIARRHPNAVLVIKGLSGMYRSNEWAAQAIAQLEPEDRRVVAKRVVYHGGVMTTAELAALYQMADCYVAPYQSEGFCIPALEAAACGCSLVVTDGGATDDFTTDDFALKVRARLADHSHDGSMWLLTDQKHIEEQMERAMLDTEFATVARLRGPEHVHARYTWRRVVDSLLSVVL